MTTDTTDMTETQDIGVGSQVFLPSDPFTVETVTRVAIDKRGTKWLYTSLSDGRVRTIGVPAHMVRLAAPNRERI